MKKFLLIFALHFIAFPLYAQMDEWGWEKIDSAYMVCQYEYKYYTSINEVEIVDDMRLEIGKKMTKFYSYATLAYDSLLSTEEGRLMVRKMSIETLRKASQPQARKESAKIILQGPSRRSAFNIYTDYPKGRILVQDWIADFYKYEEEMIPQDWHITEDTLSIIGYPCQKAMCSWRGRDYIAWFTTDIPINKGPMKFCGLPGLIMKVEDTQQKFCFEIKGIQQTSGKPIYLSKPFKQGEEYHLTTRIEILKKGEKRYQNMIRQLNRNLNKIGKVSNLDEKEKNLMELE